jgi:hypothetical protein
MNSMDMFGVSQFLRDYPGMSTGACRGTTTVLKGSFSFSATYQNNEKLTDTYQIEITVPVEFPCKLPTVKEVGGKIPRDSKHHVNLDKTLCLGSPLRLLQKISAEPTVNGFAENCLVPFLYAVSSKLVNGSEFPFGELDHGEKGIVEDYMELLNLKSKWQVENFLELLGAKRRIANKLNCPCSCGRRLGACSFHRVLNKYRKLAPRSWFKAHKNNLGAGM